MRLCHRIALNLWNFHDAIGWDCWVPALPPYGCPWFQTRSVVPVDQPLFRCSPVVKIKLWYQPINPPIPSKELTYDMTYPTEIIDSNMPALGGDMFSCQEGILCFFLGVSSCRPVQCLEAVGILSRTFHRFAPPTQCPSTIGGIRQLRGFANLRGERCSNLQIVSPYSEHTYGKISGNWCKKRWGSLKVLHKMCIVGDSWIHAMRPCVACRFCAGTLPQTTVTLRNQDNVARRVKVWHSAGSSFDGSHL